MEVDGGILTEALQLKHWLRWVQVDFSRARALQVTYLVGGSSIAAGDDRELVPHTARVNHLGYDDLSLLVDLR